MCYLVLTDIRTSKNRLNQSRSAQQSWSVQPLSFDLIESLPLKFFGFAGLGKGSKVTFHFQNQTTEPFQLSADKLQNGLSISSSFCNVACSHILLEISGICAENQKEVKKFIIGYDATVAIKFS